MLAAFHRLEVAQIRPETPEAVSVVFAVPEQLSQAYRFDPGQHLTLRTMLRGIETRRSYSICAGLDDGELRIAVKKVEDGVFSRWLNERVKPGDWIDVMTPQGRFGLRPDPVAARTYLAIAAGSGITPIISIVRSVLERERKSRVVLIYGNRTTQSIIFKEALEDLKDRFLDRFSLLHVLSRERQEVALLDVLRLLVEAHPNHADAASRAAQAALLTAHIRNTIGIGVEVVVGDPGGVERSVGKARRVIDLRPPG